MIADIGISKLSKYHFYKNEVNCYNQYVEKLINKFGGFDKFPDSERQNIVRLRAKIVRYAEENSIEQISEEIISKTMAVTEV